MRIFAVSDIHIDYKDNYNWLLNLSTLDYREDILLLAGDITDNLTLLEECFVHLNKIFYKVVFVPGNHELWLRAESEKTSIDKFTAIIKLAGEIGIHTQSFSEGAVTIIPLLSWYDLSFGPVDDDTASIWADFRHCVWPPEWSLSDVTAYFLSQNTLSPQEKENTVISFSHFLPWIELMPDFIPERHRKIFPLLGSQKLGKQIDTIKPDIHVYGHSHINQNKYINGVRYINNALGYPSEKWFKKELFCIYK